MEAGSIQELSTLINMKINILVVGSLQENCYIVTIGNNSFIVDPGDEAERIISACKDKNIKEILVTHHHFDHVGALKKVEEYFGLKENIKSGLFDYEVIKTPGHTDDSLTYYFSNEKVMFTGDFLFYHTIGRCDLPTGSEEDMVKSLELISEYPDNIEIYPGHGPKTSLGKEKQNFKYYF